MFSIRSKPNNVFIRHIRPLLLIDAVNIDDVFSKPDFHELLDVCVHWRSFVIIVVFFFFKR